MCSWSVSSRGIPATVGCGFDVTSAVLMRVTQALLAKEAFTATVALKLWFPGFNESKNVETELQKLGPVTFKNLIDIGQLLLNTFIVYSVIYGPKNYIWRKK